MNRDELRLLLALQEHPTSSAASLGAMVGVSPPTATAWLKRLRSENVYTGVHADLNVQRLGLEIDDFLIEPVSYDALQKLEQFCDEHPYTLYRARIFGGGVQGLYAQFRYPDEARKHLESAFDTIRDNELIQAVRELPTLRREYGSTYTRPRLENWDMENMTWIFDWDEWWRTARQPDKDSLPPPREKEMIIDLDALDAQLLEEMTKDARQKNTDIIQKIGMNKNQMGVQQKVSARIGRLRREAIESYRVFINWNRFDIYSTVLAIARASREVTDKLAEHLSSTAFPFESGMRRTPEGFVWSARMPSAHLSELVALLWRISVSYELLSIDYKQSQFYGLWAQTFDADMRYWKHDAEFCLEKPMSAVGLG